MSSDFSDIFSVGGKKRLPSMASTADEPVVRRKRARISSMTAEFQAKLSGEMSSINCSGVSILAIDFTHATDTHSPLSQLDRLPRSHIPSHDELFDIPSVLPYARSFSGGSSFGGLQRSTSLRLKENGPIPHPEMEMMRSVSAASFRSSSPIQPTYSEISAKHYLRNNKVAIDFAPPSDDAAVAGALPLSISSENILLFARGNRVHYKNMSTNEDIGQLCRVSDSSGHLRCVVSGVDQSSIAVGTSKGVQLWDLACKKMTMSWSAQEVTAVQWNGPVLTVGGLKGTIRHFDTRIKETPKMKEQARKVTRHQAMITRLAWNVDGNFLASGDGSGTVYCWDSRQRIPLDIGEFVQRRKKMQHPGAITVSFSSPTYYFSNHG